MRSGCRLRSESCHMSVRYCTGLVSALHNVSRSNAVLVHLSPKRSGATQHALTCTLAVVLFAKVEPARCVCCIARIAVAVVQMHVYVKASMAWQLCMRHAHGLVALQGLAGTVAKPEVVGTSIDLPKSWPRLQRSRIPDLLLDLGRVPGQLLGLIRNPVHLRNPNKAARDSCRSLGRRRQPSCKPCTMC